MNVMKLKRKLVVCFLLVLCVGVFAMSAEAKWKTSNGKTKYYLSSTGEYVKNTWKKIGGKWYYFDKKGYLKTGRFQVDGKYYYAKRSTGRVTRKKVGSYYYGKDGVMIKNRWKKCGKYIWYFGRNGKQKVGRFKVNGKYYYAKRSTGRVTKKKIGEYYYGEDGAMVTSRWVRDCYYDEQGKMKIGKFTLNGKTYCCRSNGKKVKDTWYKKNYYDEHGVMAKNTWINGSYVDEHGIIIKGNKDPIDPPTPYETKLLAAITYLEAGNQSYRGKVAVASVVINRVKSRRFPDTLKGVIYQSGQFTPACNGTLDMLMNSGKRIQRECMRAAKEVLTEGSKLKGYYFFDQGGYGLQIGVHYFH